MMQQASESTAVRGRYAGFIAILTVGIAAGAAVATVLRTPLLPRSQGTANPPPGPADEWLGIGAACRPPGAGT